MKTVSVHGQKEKRMRLIDADALETECYLGADVVHKEWLDNAPTVDAVPVIRCGECKHITHTPHKWYCPVNKKVVDRDEFCCWAERKSLKP